MQTRIMDANCRKRARDHEVAESRQETRPSKQSALSCSCPLLSEGIRSVAIEERVGGLMRELMEEIGITQPALHLPHHHLRHDECIAAASDLPFSTPSYSCDSASSSTSCSSKPADAHYLSAEYSDDLVVADTDVQGLGDVDSALLFDLAATANEYEAGASAFGSPDDGGVSTSGQNFLESANTPSPYNDSDYNWLQNVFFGSDDICCHVGDDTVDLQTFPWEEEVALWCFTCEDDAMAVGLDGNTA